MIFGPGAVGKMTVGRALAARTGLRLFHNHMTIDLALNFFPFGSPPFSRLVREFRTRIFEEVAGSDLPGLIFTYVWALNHPGDRAFVDRLTGIFAARGGRISYVELYAPQAVRLQRNVLPDRLAEKPSKRDIVRSERNLRDADETYRLNSDGDFYYPDRHLRLDVSTLAPHEAAALIVDAFDLPTVAQAGDEKDD